MMINAESLALGDGGTDADVVDQLTPVADSVDDAGLDPAYVTKTRHGESNQADLIDQAITVVLPDEADYEHAAEIES
jgi:hypothetical protein